MDRPIFRRLALASLLLIAGVAGWLAVIGRSWDGAALAGLALLGLGLLRAGTRLPSLFLLLFVAAGIVNASGYVFDLWHERTAFDETVHAFTSFAICAPLAWLLLHRTNLIGGDRNFRLAVAVTLIGIGLGILWELFEWLIGIIGAPRDTFIDLVMDALGALAAALFCAATVRRAGRRPETPATDRLRVA